jgi:tripartite ATP-independent transporter DctP family solute receptor
LSVETQKKRARWSASQVHAQPPESHLQKFLEDLWGAVRAETDGRLDVTVHPYSMAVAGAGPNVVKKVVAGEIEFHVLMGGVLGQVVPAMEIQGLPFAYTSSEQVAHVMDGALGEYLRHEMAAKGLHAFPCGLMENGFRQMVSVHKPVLGAEDLAGYRMRVPAGRVFADLFDSLGAVPVTVNIDRLYASLREGEVDGQENPLVVTEENKLYEVSTYVSVTNHMWSGFNLYGNLAFWNALPADVQEIVQRNVRKFVLQQRENVRRLNKALETRLVDRGMKFHTADAQSFRRRLGAGFYARWKTELGATAWSLLEKEIGRLA